MVAKRGRRSPSKMSRVGSWKLSGAQSPRSAGKLTAGHGGRSPPIRLDNYVSNGSIYAYIIPGGFPGRILLDWFPKGGCKNTQSIVYYLKKTVTHMPASIHRVSGNRPSFFTANHAIARDCLKCFGVFHGTRNSVQCIGIQGKYHKYIISNSEWRFNTVCPC